MVRTTPRGWLPASPPPDAARAGLITNTAEPGIGNAYRLTPEGATFDVEPTLELRLAEEDVAGTSGDFLGIATQDEDGRWAVMSDAAFDEDTHTLSVETPHFSDWVAIHMTKLIPKSREVEINGGTSLEIKDCIYARKKGEPLFAGPCISQAEANIGEIAPLPFLADAKSWAVNGKVRGSAKTGTILDLTPEMAYYSAPDNQRTVTVSVKNEKGKVLSAPIKVVAPHVDVVVAMAEPNSVMPCIFGYGSVDDGASFSLGADATGKLVAKDLTNQTAMTTTFVTTGTVTQDVQPIWDIKKVTVLTANQDAAGNQQVELQLDVTRQGGVCTWTLPESEPIVSDPGPVQAGKVAIVLKFNTKDLPKTITSPQTPGYKFTVQKP